MFNQTFTPGSQCQYQYQDIHLMTWLLEHSADHCTLSQLFLFTLSLSLVSLISSCLTDISRLLHQVLLRRHLAVRCPVPGSSAGPTDDWRGTCSSLQSYSGAALPSQPSSAWRTAGLADTTTATTAIYLRHQELDWPVTMYHRSHWHTQGIFLVENISSVFLLQNLYIVLCCHCHVQQYEAARCTDG